MSKITPKAAEYGMISVTKERFFGVIGQLDVHPSIDGNYDATVGYLSKFKTRQGGVIGAMVGGTSLAHAAYMVTPEFYAANRAKFQ